MNEDVEVFDLTSLPGWERLLENMYRDLYLPSFPNVDERESPVDWIPRLEVNRPLPPQPVTYIFLTGSDLTIPDESHRSVHGFLIAELYQQSMSALLTYLVVAGPYRRHGLARRLMDRAVSQLKVKATEFDGPLRAIFAEVHDPMVAEKNGPLDPRTRLDVMAKLGGRRVPITYVQPALGHDQARVRSLLLLTFPLDNQPVTMIRTQVVKEFLGEFYCAEGVTDPSRDADFVRMIGDETREEIPL
jgi:GNAT superfamily N-acetyltransferase